MYPIDDSRHSMPELRKDPIINRWVIVACERAKRPIAARVEIPKKTMGFCPLCPGNEGKTAETVSSYYYAESDCGETDWRLRVVLNKFPALIREGDSEPQLDGLYERMDGIGAHEVVIETPDHFSSLADFDVRQVQCVLEAYRERISVLREDARFRYILVFKNYGAEAGASLEHPHSQIIALPVVPKRVYEEMQGANAYFEKHGRCVFCEIVRHEKADGRRVVFENDDFIAIQPYAARFPFETWILPVRHETHFEAMDDERLENLAFILRKLMHRIKAVLNDPPYNFMLHTSPCKDSDINCRYHWHLEITPKLTKIAGFEWGTGFFINPMPPETAAELLRDGNSDKVNLSKP